MNPLPPSLPSLKDLPGYVVIDGLTGYICGKLSQTNPYLIATVFAIRSLAHALFYHIANYVLGAKDLQSQKIFLVTSTLVNMIFLIALKELNVIGRLVSCLLGLATLGYLINRVSYIQDQERQ
jgi:hypothetical protein